MTASAPLPHEAQPIFYYDLGSPDCYLAAERIMTALPIVPEWEPVHGATILGTREAPDRASIERRAAERQLQALRWPARCPPDTSFAMLAATYAKHVGRGVAFSLAAFRQAFAAGRDLADQNTVLLAAAACEMHPAAVLKGVELRSVRTALERAGERARRAGVSVLPAVQVGEQIFQTDERLEAAAAALTASAS